MATKYFQVNVQTVGTIGGIHETKDGFGFDVEETSPPFSRWNKVDAFIHNGRVAISTELFNYIAGSTMWLQSDFTLGRTQFYDIERHTDQILDHITYGSRNDNERDVRTRNQAIFEWLISLL